jgi:hypothetical protein
MHFSDLIAGFGLDQMDEKSYSWVMELAENNSTVLPSLELVELEQRCGGVGWEWYPEVLQEAFLNAEIDLFIAEPS